MTPLVFAKRSNAITSPAPAKAKIIPTDIERLLDDRLRESQRIS